MVGIPIVIYTIIVVVNVACITKITAYSIEFLIIYKIRGIISINAATVRTAYIASNTVIVHIVNIIFKLLIL